jgi:hypothetical protein
MTRSREKGENEFTRAAKREALQTGVSVGDILKRMLDEAKEAKDTASWIKIARAQKFLGKRNPRKRRRRR